MLNWKDNWERLRRFIDNEEEDRIPDGIEAARRKRSESETFLQMLIEAVEENLRHEITRIPNAQKAYVPSAFKIFLSADAHKNLRDDKRRFFEQGLSAVVLERAQSMTEGLELSAKKVTVEIGLDATLESGDIRVVAFSDDRAKTVSSFVVPPLPPTVASPAPPPKTVASPVEPIHTDPLPEPPASKRAPQNTIEDAGTIEDFDTMPGLLCRIEVRQGGKLLSDVPVVRQKITVGRDDDEKFANVRLPSENRKISREHAEIAFEPGGAVWVTAKHKNPTVVSGQVIRSGERAKLGPDREIQIYDFVLRIK